MSSKSFYRALDSSLLARNSGQCRDGVFQSTAYTIGPWNKSLQHGGPPLALCVRSLEGKAGDLGLPNVVHVVGRFFRPVPVTKIRVVCSVVKEGTKAAHIEASLLEESSRKELLRVTAVCLREENVAGAPPVPEEAQIPKLELPSQNLTTTTNDSDVEADINDCCGWHYGTRIGLNPLQAEALRGKEEDCYLKAFTFNQVSGEYGKGPTAVWAKQLVSTVEDEPSSPLEKLITLADSVNGLSYYTNWADYTFINSDITVMCHKKPQGEAIGLKSKTVLSPSVGSGLATGELFDSLDGSHVGTVHQSLLLQRRV